MRTDHKCRLLSFPDQRAWIMVALLMSATSGSADDETVDPDGIAFFEREVRPILVEHCYECHSSKSETIEANLRLDTKKGWEVGGDNGAALVAGQPAASLLVRAVGFEGDIQMPPKGKLPSSAIAALTKWVAMGAPDPRTGDDGVEPAKNSIDVESAKDYWAFRNLARPIPPPAAGPRPAENAVDLFVDARLAEAGIARNDPADRQRLLRRATLDLTGIPPTREDMEAYLADTRPDAYERHVDRLLADPGLGVRWGRHWLDIARFAESFGFEHDYDRPHAYHFRDFVVEAFNGDMPFEQFVRWQLAGDEFAPEEPLALMATGFLGAGVFPTQITANEVERTRYDALDDMLSTVGSGILGLSIGCARCHDHKFDPIRSRDYYEMLSTFTTTVRSDVELDLVPEANRQAWLTFEQRREELERQKRAYEDGVLADRVSAWIADGRWALPKGWSQVSMKSVRSEGGATFAPVGDGSWLASGTNPAKDVYTLDANVTDKQIASVRIEALADPSLPKGGPGRAGNGNFGLTSVEVRVASADQPEAARVIPIRSVRTTFAQAGLSADGVKDPAGGCWAVDPKFGKDHSLALELAEAVSAPGGVLTVKLTFACNDQHNIGRIRLAVSSDSQTLPFASLVDPALVLAVESIRRGEAWSSLPDDARRKLASRFGFTDLTWQQHQVALLGHLRRAPKPTLTKVMVTSEGVTPIRWHTQGGDFLEQTHFLRRGDTNSKGDVMAQNFLPVLSRSSGGSATWKESPPAGAKTSYRRRSLANWITDAEYGAGSLAYRVMANRLWQHHFGEGIVSTPNDFGVQGEKPTHPELLDWLASELREQGGHLKSVHRLLVTSGTYRQSSAYEAAKRQIDPAGRLVWRFTPRRLEGESIRDAILASAGILDTSMGGAGTLDDKHRRRAIYFTVKRSQLVPMMLLFDGPDTLTSLGRRSRTTTAPQALLFLNDPQVRQWATALAKRAMAEAPDAAGRIDRAYQLAVTRPPTEDERSPTLAFLGNDPGADEQRLADLTQVLLGLNEFLYLE